MRMTPVAVTLLLCGLAACTHPVDQAVAETRVKAERVGRVMIRVNTTRLGVDFARIAVALSGPGMRVQALEARGDKFADGATVVLEITVTGPYGLKGGLVSATRCYRYSISNRIQAHQPEDVDCAGRHPITLPEPTPEPSIPQGADVRLRAALRELPLPDRSDPEAVRRAGERAVPGRGLTYRTARYRGWTGIAITPGPRRCLMGRVSGHTIQVWSPPRITLEPGELGCTAKVAASATGQRPPH